eukprot:m.438037 g.438037  ORF g.438037 m.438037 type:complete len:55 (-) comp18184_c0_seq1:396-560(-)
MGALWDPPLLARAANGPDVAWVGVQALSRRPQGNLAVRPQCHSLTTLHFGSLKS